LLVLARPATRRTACRIAVLLAAVVTFAVACTPLNSQEQYLLKSVNELRAANHLAPLGEYEPLTDKARDWANALASKAMLAHEDLGQLGMSWTMAAENVGRSTSIEDIASRLAASPEHRANMLNGGYQLIGIGTARAKDGMIYAVQIFIRPG